MEILEDLCVAAPPAATVVLAGEMNELLSPYATQLATEWAVKHGLARAGVSDAGSPYPVDANGVVDDDLCTGKRAGVVGYRRTIHFLSIAT